MRTSVVPLFLLGLGVVLAQDRRSPDAKPTVVFVCEHGSAKSVIAASEFERMAKEKGLDVKILARGANPDAEIPKLVRDGLKADGYDVGNLKPTKVSEKDLKGAAKIVSFGPDLKPLLTDGAVVSDWSATPSVSEDYRAARDYIRQQLEILLKDLRKQQ
jgi:arsenate reductase (thioredoxin)